jgi:hypothetical protein
MESSSNLVGMSAVNHSRDDLRSTWGITPGYYLWPTTIKILFVIDGRIQLSKVEFGLWYVLDTLTAPFSWWVRFDVDVAKRDGEAVDVDPFRPFNLKYKNFKFTNDDFDLDTYDQVWFFADRPNRNDGADGTTDDEIQPFLLEDGELKLVADWMDRGGGVFAAGDHSILGASTCSKIPRVRTMRKWTHAQDVPTRDGSTQHQTLQPNPPLAGDDLEGDTVLQPIELVYRRATGALPFQRPLVPHPLLSSRLGVIDRFPDHMHEGEVIGDERVNLDLPLEIPGYDRPEYPSVISEVLASGAQDVGAVVPQRPRPEVIAYGQTTNSYWEPPVVLGALARFNPPLGLSKRFGLVGVYDGDPVRIGRVVVDSTWHHWFAHNLVGIAKAVEPPETISMVIPGLANTIEATKVPYEKMQAYYRNVGMWLATPAQRASMLISGIWGVLTGSAPMEFSTKDSPWQIGERVLDILGLTVSQCMLGAFVAPLLDQALTASSARNELPQSEPSWSRLPEDLVNRALVGGIGSALLELALHEREKRARGQRPRLNREAIRQRAVEGVSRGHALLRKSVEDAATAIGSLHATLSVSGVSRPIDVRIPIEVRRLRVVAETLQLPEPGDPVLIGSHVTLTIRIRLDDSVVAHQILERVELPPFEARGSIIDLSCDVGDVEVQTGESLSIEVLVGSWTSEEVNPEVIRFKDTLRGDASKWIGKSTPARSQAWRLWYRIEESRPHSYAA